MTGFFYLLEHAVLVQLTARLVAIRLTAQDVYQDTTSRVEVVRLRRPLHQTAISIAHQQCAAPLPAEQQMPTLHYALHILLWITFWPMLTLRY